MQPTAAFKSASVKSLTENGLAVDFDLDVGNPNSFALPVSGVSYKLGLGGANVLSDKANPTASIPAQGTLPVTVPVTLSLEKLLSAKDAIASSGGNVPYDFDGVIELSAGPLKALGQSVKVPVKYSGTLAIKDAVKDPVALLSSPAGRKILELLAGSKSGLIGNMLGK